MSHQVAMMATCNSTICSRSLPISARAPVGEELLPEHEVVRGGVLHVAAVELPRVGRREDADPAAAALELLLGAPHDLDLLARQTRVAQARPDAVHAAA